MASENGIKATSIGHLFNLVEAGEAWFSDKFDSLFVHADFEAFAAWIRMSIAQKTYKKV